MEQTCMMPLSLELAHSTHLQRGFLPRCLLFQNWIVRLIFLCVSHCKSCFVYHGELEVNAMVIVLAMKWLKCMFWSPYTCEGVMRQRPRQPHISCMTYILKRKRKRGVSGLLPSTWRHDCNTLQRMATHRYKKMSFDVGMIVKKFHFSGWSDDI